MTQMPMVDRILYKNRVADYIRRGPGMRLLQLAGSAIHDRKVAIAGGVAKLSEQRESPKDFLSRFLEAQDTDASLPPW